MTKVLIIFFIFNTSTIAANLSFLKNSPISSFSKQDSLLMQQTIIKVLDELADGGKLNWQNPDSQVSGSVSVSDTHKQKVQGMEQVCRQIKLVNKVKIQQQNSIFIYCKDKENSWKIIN